MVKPPTRMSYETRSRAPSGARRYPLPSTGVRTAPRPTMPMHPIPGPTRRQQPCPPDNRTAVNSEWAERRDTSDLQQSPTPWRRPGRLRMPTHEGDRGTAQTEPTKGNQAAAPARQPHDGTTLAVQQPRAPSGRPERLRSMRTREGDRSARAAPNPPGDQAAAQHANPTRQPPRRLVLTSSIEATRATGAPAQRRTHQGKGQLGGPTSATKRRSWLDRRGGAGGCVMGGPAWAGRQMKLPPSGC
jgi:hypothetical protein